MSGTPAFIINGRFLSGAVGFDELKKQVDQARLAKSK
jgi:protein-disulfide isomerase